MDGSSRREVRERIDGLEAQRRTLSAELRDLEARIAGLTTEREERYGELAAGYLPAMDETTVRATREVLDGLRGARERIDGIFGEKRRRRAELEESLEASARKKKELQEELEKLDGRRREVAARADALEAEVGRDLEGNARHRELTGRAAEAEGRLRAAEEALEKGRAEAAAKLVPYRASRPFLYLIERRFGTPEAKGIGLTRLLDARLAEHVKFARNKRGFEYWARIPEVLRRKSDLARRELEVLAGEKGAIEQEAASRRGLLPVIEEARKLDGEREKLVAAIGEADRSYAGAAGGLEELAAKDPFHRQAVGELKGWLQGDSMAGLRARADRTPGSRDDAIVSRIDAIDGEVAALKARARDVSIQERGAAARAGELRDIETTYYDRRRGSFDGGFDPRPLLEMFILGRMTGGDLRGHFDRHHHEPEPEPSRSSWGSGGSVFGHGHGSGGFGSGGFGSGGHSSGSSSGSSHSTTGSFGGGGKGDFRTTDRF